MDLADIYGPAEDFIDEFRSRLLALKGKEELDRIQSLTKREPKPGINPQFTDDTNLEDI